jgi:hypothetical protein
MRAQSPQSIETTCQSIEVAARSPGELRCLSRRTPRQPKDRLDLNTRIGPGEIFRSGDDELVRD